MNADERREKQEQQLNRQGAKNLAIETKISTAEDAGDTEEEQSNADTRVALLPSALNCNWYKKY
jgi:hypothetical protein